MTESSKKKIRMVIPILICFAGVIGMSIFWLNEYRQASFEHISKLCQIIIEDYPEAEAVVLSSLKEYHIETEPEIEKNEFLIKYGYEKNDFDNDIQLKFVVLTLITFFVITGGFLFYIRYKDKRNQIRIAELTNFLERVNIGVFDKIIQTQEDEFSHLEDEIYKTVTTLRQTRDTAVKTKENFADNLANIAHQLKTKITSLSLSVQLLKQSNSTTYIKQIENQLERLNWLEETLLTISKIDAGALQLEHSKVDVYTALTLAAENLDELLIKKNVFVDIPNKGCIEINGDLEWTRNNI